MDELKPDEARAVLQEEQKRKQKECWAELIAVMDKYELTLDAVFELSARGIVPSIRLIPKTREGR